MVVIQCTIFTTAIKHRKQAIASFLHAVRNKSGEGVNTAVNYMEILPCHLFAMVNKCLNSGIHYSELTYIQIE